jgi:hypothetical protein
MRMQINEFTLPRRSSSGVYTASSPSSLPNLGAGADWGAIAAEYLHGEPTSTPLGRPKPRSSTATVGRRAPLSRPPTRHLPTA